MNGLLIIIRRSVLGIIVLTLAIPLLGGIRQSADPIPGEYIVILRKNIPMSQLTGRAGDLAHQFGGSVRRVMRGTANGFSVNMNERQATLLAAHPDVLVVEENGWVEISLTQTLPTSNELYNLDRIDQRNAIGSGDDYYTYCSLGTGVNVYVVDTGILKTHNEFAGIFGGSRVLDGVCFAGDCNYPSGADKGTLPCGGFTTNLAGSHGTAVASVAAGVTTGVAKNASLVPVRVLDCNASGTYEHLNWGLDWIRSPDNPHRYSGSTQRPAVVNMSTFYRTTNYACERRSATGETGLCFNDIDDDCDGLTDEADFDCGGTCDPITGIGCQAAAIEHVINDLVLDGTTPDDLEWTGIPVIVSANNQGTQWNNTTPARLAYSNSSYHPSAARVISVGATTATDARWQCPTYVGELCWNDALNDGTLTVYGSNFGPTVDIWAPGHLIKTAYTTSNSAYRTQHESKSGTSFAAPLVAGVVALMRENQPSLTPAQLWTQLSANASTAANVIDPVTLSRKIVFNQGCSP